MAPATNFTPRAQQVLALARREADRLNHNFLGTEHLLLGMIKLGQGTAVNVLEKKGLNLKAIALDVEKQVGTGPDQKMIGNIPYTPRVKKVIALAQKEAKQLNHANVGTEHLLLGLLREGDGVTAVVLRSLDVDLEQTRQDILREVYPNMASESVSERKTIDISNLTPRAAQVLALAREEAVRLGHEFVGTEHLLLGLIKLGQGVAVNVLQKMGLNLETARAVVEICLPKGPGQTEIKNLRFLPQTKEVFSLADNELRRLNHTYLGTEHILLGILASKDEATAKMWAKFEIDRDQVREEILRELDPNFSGTPIAERKSDEMPQPPKPDAVPTTGRYDVYCTERSTEIVVYRNARFKGIKRLLNSSQHDSMGQFIELEQADGQTVFVSRFSVIKFCAPGVMPGGETISP